MSQEVRFQKGPANTMPTTLIPGTISIQTDLGNIFLDVDNSTRIQLKDNTKLSLTGGTITGNIKVTTSSDPTTYTHITDQNILIANNSSQLYLYNGSLNLKTNGSSGGLEGSIYFLNSSDDTLILRNISAPQEDYDAVNKAYVDDAISAITGGTTPLSSGTIFYTDTELSVANKVINNSVPPQNSYFFVVFSNGFDSSIQNYLIFDGDTTLYPIYEDTNKSFQLHSSGKGAVALLFRSSNSLFFYGFMNYIDDGNLT